eukprot:3326606-Rhodomonas_salina.5
MRLATLAATRDCAFSKLALRGCATSDSQQTRISRTARISVESRSQQNEQGSGNGSPQGTDSNSTTTGAPKSQRKSWKGTTARVRTFASVVAMTLTNSAFAIVG